MQQKIGVLADVHGNLTALKSVIADAKANGVTEFWSLGDIATYGPGTVASYRLLKQENTTIFLQGNWESSYFEVETGTDVNFNDASDVAFLDWMAQDYSDFTNEEIAAIRRFPMKYQVQRAGLTIELMHNMPNKNYGSDLSPDAPQANFNNIFQDIDADMAIYAHIHAQIMRSDNITYEPYRMHRILNTGTVGQSYQLTKTGMVAQYLLLTLDDDIGVTSADFRRVNYDTAQEIAFARQVDWPFYEAYVRMLETGQFTRDADSLAADKRFPEYQAQAKIFYQQLKGE
ncbi:hypothetical protein LKI_04320 [Leuconostoc kimchii IMSNU 11154]|uniref:Calcineurin-like phosphoesterase domain-containing protein n=1 Tax=Leuconostoc kimchii (strain IMSNU 11154 / KCTC 2386 / IH25) TaxID=762051 RepID=D5T2A7_LEUKI|nr:metallophosphoesterase family protein [Leuconostoc kimchii]ADG40406.1 hypothetical protein LKI_04320 [Leuconostoc kimchii IMSNU 11154]